MQDACHGQAVLSRHTASEQPGNDNLQSPRGNGPQPARPDARHNNYRNYRPAAAGGPPPPPPSSSLLQNPPIPSIIRAATPAARREPPPRPSIEAQLPQAATQQPSARRALSRAQAAPWALRMWLRRPVSKASRSNQWPLCEHPRPWPVAVPQLQHDRHHTHCAPPPPPPSTAKWSARVDRPRQGVMARQGATRARQKQNHQRARSFQSPRSARTGLCDNKGCEDECEDEESDGGRYLVAVAAGHGEVAALVRRQRRHAWAAEPRALAEELALEQRVRRRVLRRAQGRLPRRRRRRRRLQWRVGPPAKWRGHGGAARRREFLRPSSAGQWRPMRGI
jgi:hypothetical protein